MKFFTQKRTEQVTEDRDAQQFTFRTISIMAFGTALPILLLALTLIGRTITSTFTCVHRFEVSVNLTGLYKSN